MLRCPECGSLNNFQLSLISDTNHLCGSCGNKFTEKESKELTNLWDKYADLKTKEETIQKRMHELFEEIQDKRLLQELRK
jgi:transcription elongation factor Elf1